MDYLRDPDETRSCEYNPRSSAPLGFLFRPLKSVNTLRAQNKNPSAYGTRIVFDVGHTGFERIKIKPVKYSITEIYKFCVFCLFRFYGPLQAYFDKTWAPNDFKKIK